MKRKLFAGATMVACAVLGVGAAVALAGGGKDNNPTPTGGGHTPVTFCHKPGTPAQHEITSDDDGFVQGHLGHGDTLGPCPGDPPTTTGEEPTTTTTTTPPSPPAPPRTCPDGGPPNSGKDGQVPASGNTNDDCDRSAPPTPVASTPTEAPPVTPPTTTTTATQPSAVETSSAGPATKQPKPDAPTIVKVEKQPHGVVKITTSDGKVTTGIMGNG